MLTTPKNQLSNIPPNRSRFAEEVLAEREKLAVLLSSKFPAEFGSNKYQLLSEIANDPEAFAARLLQFHRSVKQRLFEFDNPPKLVWGSVPTAHQVGMPPSTFRKLVSEFDIPSDCIADGKPAYSLEWIGRFSANSYLLKEARTLSKSGNKDGARKKISEFAATLRPKSLAAKETAPKSLLEIL